MAAPPSDNLQAAASDSLQAAASGNLPAASVPLVDSVLPVGSGSLRAASGNLPVVAFRLRVLPVASVSLEGGERRLLRSPIARRSSSA